MNLSQFPFSLQRVPLSQNNLDFTVYLSGKWQKTRKTSFFAIISFKMTACQWFLLLWNLFIQFNHADHFESIHIEYDQKFLNLDLSKSVSISTRFRLFLELRKWFWARWIPLALLITPMWNNWLCDLKQPNSTALNLTWRPLFGLPVHKMNSVGTISIFEFKSPTKFIKLMSIPFTLTTKHLKKH
jgi:hypothetical protein